MPPEVVKLNGPSLEHPGRAHAIDPSPATSAPPSAVDEISNSWHRCMADYHVDPKNQSAPNVVTQSELRVSKEPVADIITHAREEIDRNASCAAWSRGRSIA